MDKLKLYWSKADSDTLLTLNSHWSGNRYSNGALLGNSICTVNIPANIHSCQSARIVIPWKIPDPANYFGITNDHLKYYILARIESVNDTMNFY